MLYNIIYIFKSFEIANDTITTSLSPESDILKINFFHNINFFINFNTLLIKKKNALVNEDQYKKFI